MYSYNLHHVAGKFSPQHCWVLRVLMELSCPVPHLRQLLQLGICLVRYFYMDGGIKKVRLLLQPGLHNVRCSGRTVPCPTMPPFVAQIEADIVVETI